MTERVSCFIIMPYSRDSDDVYQRAVLPALKSVEDPTVLPLRADQMISDITLKAHVERSVQAADFCVVDITGGNPNVMYELGFAVASRKPLLVIQEAGRGDAPADLQGIQTWNYSRSDLPSFSGRLSGAIRKLVASLAQVRRAEEVDHTLASLSDVGLLERFALSIRSTFAALVGSPRVIVDTILPRLEALDPGELLVRIVCTDPEGEFARIRSEDSGIRVSEYRVELWHKLEQLRRGLATLKGARSEVRLTAAALGTSLYISDDSALIFPYLAAGASRELVGIAFERSRDPQSFSLFQKQFGKAWSASYHLPTRIGRSATGSDQDGT